MRTYSLDRSHYHYACCLSCSSCLLPLLLLTIHMPCWWWWWCKQIAYESANASIIYARNHDTSQFAAHARANADGGCGEMMRVCETDRKWERERDGAQTERWLRVVTARWVETTHTVLPPGRKLLRSKCTRPAHSNHASITTHSSSIKLTSAWIPTSKQLNCPTQHRYICVWFGE